MLRSMSLPVVLLLTFCLAPSAGAASHGVSCATDPAALRNLVSGLSRQEPQSISVTGACEGPVLVRGFHQGFSLNRGGTASITLGGGVSAPALLSIVDSTPVELKGLTVRGPDPAQRTNLVTVNYSHDVVLENVTLQLGRNGLVLDKQSDVTVRYLDVSDLSLTGVDVSGSSSLNSEESLSIRNARTGLRAWNASSAQLGGLLTVEYVTASGIIAVDGNIRLLCGEGSLVRFAQNGLVSSKGILNTSCPITVSACREAGVSGGGTLSLGGLQNLGQRRGSQRGGCAGIRRRVPSDRGRDRHRESWSGSGAGSWLERAVLRGQRNGE